MRMMISLSDDLQQFVNQQVSLGRFSQPEDVIEVAVRQMRDRARKIAEIQRAMLEDDLPDLVGLRS
jgi:putative addiction module CopG family antidote